VTFLLHKYGSCYLIWLHVASIVPRTQRCHSFITNAIPCHDAATSVITKFENSARMSDKPIFVAAHPRACSTAFERVFMTQHDTITCFHEPFGDAFYYGPERLSARFPDEQARLSSGFSKSTYGSILESIKREASGVWPFYLQRSPCLNCNL
jgi:hypothetical protein